MTRAPRGELLAASSTWSPSAGGLDGGAIASGSDGAYTARSPVQTKGDEVSFQAYLDNIEEKTGRTPRELVAEAKEKGFDDPETKAGTIVDWLKQDYGLGRGHAMALVHVIKKGPQISEKHVGSGGTHSDDSNLLHLDGKRNRPST